MRIFTIESMRNFVIESIRFSIKKKAAFTQPFFSFILAAYLSSVIFLTEENSPAVKRYKYTPLGSALALKLTV